MPREVPYYGLLLSENYLLRLSQLRIFDGLDLVSKEIIENNFNDKKKIKANI